MPLTWLPPVVFANGTVIQASVEASLVATVKASVEADVQASIPALADVAVAGPESANHGAHAATQGDGKALTPDTASAPAQPPLEALTSQQVRRLRGYRVVACKVGSGWSYAAWGPDQQPREWRYREYSNGQAKHWHPEGGQIRYALGQSMPQRRQLLGTHPSAALARAQCEAHQNREAMRVAATTASPASRHQEQP
jgi:hypothetical protein